jgi:hypothetical protein
LNLHTHSVADQEAFLVLPGFRLSKMVFIKKSLKYL